MNRIPHLALDQVTPEVASTLNAVKAKIGMIPNLFSTFAYSPDVLHAYLNFEGQISKGKLTAKQREIIALAVGQVNGCHYCLSAHTLMGKGAGLSLEETHHARNGKATDAKDNAIAQLAHKITKERGHITDADLKAAHDSDLDNELIAEIVAGVALNVLTNFMNNVAKTKIDFPEVKVELTA
jgi:uncharacterized peroxidase-related enzyme